jgi:hypothetical protein
MLTILTPISKGIALSQLRTGGNEVGAEVTEEN